jgi:hypothetical protein
MGVVPFLGGHWPWKAHEITQDTHDNIQCLWRFWEAVVAVVAPVDCALQIQET